MRNLILLLIPLTALACESSDSDAGSGTAHFTVYGESFIEESIPASEVEDEWKIEFDRFLVGFGPVTIADSQRGEGETLGETTLYDLTQPGPHEVGTTEKLTAGNWDEVGYAFRPVTTETALHASTSEADRELMAEHDYVVYVEGTATREATTKTFAWGFTDTITYHECTEVDSAGEDVRQGIAVTNGGTTEVELTIHGDHFLYDDLTAANAVLRFDAIAAADDDGDGDGDVTLDELDAVQLVDISEGSYGTGSLSDVNTLGDFVRALTMTLGHYQGEGHCL